MDGGQFCDRSARTESAALFSSRPVQAAHLWVATVAWVAISIVRGRPVMTYSTLPERNHIVTV
jgi:hypothetical protein